MEYALDQHVLDSIDDILEKELVSIGIQCVFLIDLAGNIISSIDDENNPHDIYSLAALAAGNFGAVNEMAKLIGESDFSLLFHKGERESIHFSKVLEDFLLISIFSKDVSLGFVRLKVHEGIGKISHLLSPRNSLT
jgi:predicted regulator of Ras-like GTPase activity (Roadblock/LC7/MglB family)